MLPLVSAAQMRALDADAMGRLGIPGAVLMESAGRGVVEVLWRLHTRGALDLRAGRVVVVAGPGNNGGDGMVIARSLHVGGVVVTLCLCAERERVRGDALLHLQAALACGVSLQECAGEAGAAQVATLLHALGPDDVVVDALLGTGVTRAVVGPLAQVIAAINRSAAKKIAVDLPSGLDADRGVPAASLADAGLADAGLADAGPADAGPAIVRADYTVTFAFAKLGLCGAPGFTYAGTTYLVDIGVPAAGCAEQGVDARLLDAQCALRLSQTRSPLGHKGTHGHLLIIAGSRGKAGAALLCTRAALRTGVGLCTLAAPADIVDSVLGGHVVEAMSLPYEWPQPLNRIDGSEASAQLLSQSWRAAAQGKQALAIGPGLPSSPIVQAALLALIEEGTAPMVLDADALNQLVGQEPTLKRARARGRELVLTPHPGEAARLLGCSVAEVQADRVGRARALCQRTGAVVLLKGARTVIVAPARAAGSEPLALPLSICPTGNSGMGTGGMGDVLTGILGALLTAGWPAYDAACAAAYLHGRAADLLRARRAPGSLLLAGDVVDALDATRQQIYDELEAALSTDWPVREL